MARARGSSNGRLEEALAAMLQSQANLVQTQVNFVQQKTAILARMAELERITAERFARIESILLDHSRILADHSRILAEHSRVLATLPDAICEKIEFKACGQPGAPADRSRILEGAEGRN